MKNEEKNKNSNKNSRIESEKKITSFEEIK